MLAQPGIGVLRLSAGFVSGQGPSIGEGGHLPTAAWRGGVECCLGLRGGPAFASRRAGIADSKNGHIHLRNANPGGVAMRDLLLMQTANDAFGFDPPHGSPLLTRTVTFAGQSNPSLCESPTLP